MSLVELYTAGWSCRRIGRHLGMCRKDVAGALRDEGVNVTAKRPRTGNYATKANGRHVGGNRRGKAAA